jgi:hypothetical protein
MFRTYASLVVGLLVLPACPLLDVQADVQQACVTYQNVSIDPMPQVTGTLEKSFTVSDLSALKDLTDDGFQLGFASGDVRAISGVSDFSFIQAADVLITSGSADSTLPAFDFACTNCGSAASQLDVAPQGSGDAQAYIETGSLIVTLELTGTPPAVGWTIDVDVCMTGTASYEVNE